MSLRHRRSHARTRKSRSLRRGGGSSGRRMSSITRGWDGKRVKCVVFSIRRGRWERVVVRMTVRVTMRGEVGVVRRMMMGVRGLWAGGDAAEGGAGGREGMSMSMETVMGVATERRGNPVRTRTRRCRSMMLSLWRDSLGSELGGTKRFTRHPHAYDHSC